LAAIGIVIFLKQIPHALGRDNDWEGDFHFFQFMDGENTITEIFKAIVTMSPGAVIITSVSLGILILWQQPFFKKVKFISSIPAPLVVVIGGILVNEAFKHYFPVLYLGAEPSHMVQIDVLGDGQPVTDLFLLPNFAALGSSL
jgi:MFS superfamily sulfate permease-like transporter